MASGSCNDVREPSAYSLGGTRTVRPCVLSEAASKMHRAGSSDANAPLLTEEAEVTTACSTSDGEKSGLTRIDPGLDKTHKESYLNIQASTREESNDSGSTCGRLGQKVFE